MLTYLEEIFRQVLMYVSPEIVMGPEDQSDIGDFFWEFGIQANYLELLPDEQELLVKLMGEVLGVDFSQSPVRTFPWEGPEDSPGGGRAKIEVFPTNKEEVAVHRITYDDGEVSYGIGPV